MEGLESQAQESGPDSAGSHEVLRKVIYLSLGSKNFLAGLCTMHWGPGRGRKKGDSINRCLC